MKTLLRSLLILLVFSTVAVAMVIAVNGAAALAISVGILDDESEPEFTTEQEVGEGQPSRPEEVREEERGFFEMLFGWVFGLGKDIFVLSVLIAMIVLPKSVLKQLRRTNRSG
jgi:hypothetical protein